MTIPVKIRFRTDGWHFADLKAQGWTTQRMRALNCYSEEDLALFDALEPAKPGDVWRIRWHKEGPEEGPIAGYAICCPKCGQVHAWSTANNCGQKITRSYNDQEGREHSYQTCAHSGIGSCWQWSGSAEDGTLTANPSLFASGACGWHGWLRNGILHE